MEDFKNTLETFKKTLRANKVDEKLDIELKDQYGFEDVVDIATRLKDCNEGDSSVSNCMTKIKKAFRSIGKRKGILANLLSFAPNDSYGIVFCGGFSVILGVRTSTVTSGIGTDHALFYSRRSTEQAHSEKNYMR